jgi:polysaccharide export outer membrane protein
MLMKTAAFAALSFLLFASTAPAQTPNATKPSPVGTTGASAASTPASTSTDYRLVPGDKVSVQVYKDDHLSLPGVQVRPDGKITLPLVGDLTAAGHTSLELRDTITTALKDYIANPTVTVMVLETTPQVVYVTGEVNKPGALPIVNGHLSVLQALAMAGGFTDFANKKDVRILRKGARGMQTLHFNYKDALDDENRTEPLQLLPGDTVIVK